MTTSLICHMKNFLLLFLTLFFFTTFTKAADVYKLDPNHTNVTWTTNHFGFSNQSGKFPNIEGVIIIDEDNPQKSSVKVTINTYDLSTGLPEFDTYLKTSDFFDVQNYPTAEFVSTSVATFGRSGARVNGNLTLMGITKYVTLDVKLNKKGINPINRKQAIGFTATTKIKRSDFNLKFGLPGVSDEVTLNIAAEGTKESSENYYSKVPSWQIIPEQSSIRFEATQNNGNISGSFSEFDGSIKFHPYHTNQSKIEITVDTGSVNTSFSEALAIVKNSTWLAVDAFPKAIFKADQFVNMNTTRFRSIGTLTIKGKTIPINLDFNLDEFSDTTAKASGVVTIKRSAFGVGDRNVAKANGVKDDVKVIFKIAAKKI